ncbi:hypothetical protein P3X46_016365 [Hevea brasiliensis]|uniref:F-box domain-containing protein n=1 Tax=Hevea brasiliensis TaxID=3981 RepID=A0ABQ9M123_HEVBR|nr:F-box protein CPR1-like isoform X2 [Hevea brasiliensis]XP_058009417.1 F-box protein CPR1-like isoform X3 [Hevea brasiliensis]XP_058009418.1 F-box protein CPR1-like isoform X3 [Hevea brasiliensis]KAJ9173202.1 hypothetical protein P3X46_016365 [Hevea brasiliensis]
MLDRFPPEIKSDILSRLPVDDLLRFRCISKSWCAQIDDGAFIKTHLKKFFNVYSSLNLIFSGCFYLASFESLGTAVELDNPLKGPSDAHHDIKLVDSCNGLVCFGDAVGTIALLNPLTRKHHILPFLPLDFQLEGKSTWAAWAFGFGYDPISDDYKVVRLGQYLSLSDQFFDTETNVYNLKANTWRKIQGMSYVLGFDQKMGVLAGNALHWLVGRNRIMRNPNLIVAFNLEVEDFREVPAPESIGENLSIDLGVVGKWLSLTANYECMRLDVWVMKEYGVEESWTRLFVITPNEVAPLKCLRTLAFSKNGDELLLGVQAGNLVWYNLKEKSVKRVEKPISVTPFAVKAFRGSLVSPCVSKEKTDAKKARPRKGRKNRKRDEFLSEGFKLAL